MRGFFKVYNLPPYEQQQAAGRKKKVLVNLILVV
jgi:hypothetical protein